MTRHVTPRAVGERVDLEALPSHVRAWLDHELGSPVVHAATQRGGMSPGPAARVTLRDGRRFFVKAVGLELNRTTPRLHRRELAVLRQLPPAPYRPALVAAYDDGDWVVLVLDDVDGTHPDLDDPATVAALRNAVRHQTASLTPNPILLDGEDLAAAATRWHRDIESAPAEQRDTLPGWWRAQEGPLLARIRSLPPRLPSESFCHLDIRDDNMLMRRDGSPALFDWGMSRGGPSWVDEVMLDLHVVTTDAFDGRAREIPMHGSTAYSSGQRDDAITDFVLALATSVALLAVGPEPEGLPRLTSFRRREGAMLLRGAQRRLRLT
jgi:hypothetical protein